MGLTVGKIRGLQQCSSSQGTFTCLALDHRQNLRKLLAPQDPNLVSDRALTGFKLIITENLAETATAVLLDPEYSAAQAISAGVIPAKTGLVVALEETGYTGPPNARHSRLLAGWSVQKAKLMGASMLKLLVYYHPDSSAASGIESLIHDIAQECRVFDIALMLEPLSYSLDQAGSELSPVEKRQVVIASASKLSTLGVDLLKAEFPLDREIQDKGEWISACKELTAASQVPWILLSAAVDFETYLQQVEVACNAGASGVAVGRAVWIEAVGLTPEPQKEFLMTVAKQRMAMLADICDSIGRPWNEVLQLKQAISPVWYAQYNGKNDR